MRLKTIFNTQNNFLACSSIDSGPPGQYNIKKNAPRTNMEIFHREIFSVLGWRSVRKTQTSRVGAAFCGLFSATKSTIENRDRHVVYRVWSSLSECCSGRVYNVQCRWTHNTEQTQTTISTTSVMYPGPWRSSIILCRSVAIRDHPLSSMASPWRSGIIPCRSVKINHHAGPWRSIIMWR